MSEDLHFLELTEVARRLRERALSPVELTERMLARIEAVDPALHAYARTMPESARAEARRAEEEIARGGWRGPLHGVPVAVKDNCHAAGVVCANGTEVYADFRPERDSTVVRKLREAGAVILGKLQHTEGAFAEHHRSIVAPVNPWNADQWPGASSSGSGVGTAAGLCFGSLGTDTGGSIRFPCAANNLTGLKPSWGRVSRFGVFENSASLDHVGPMTRSAADAAAMLAALAGADEDDPTALPDAVPDYLALSGQSVAGLRIGIDAEHIARDVDAPTRAAMQAALATLTGLGATLREVRLPDPSEVIAGWLRFSAVEMAAAHEATYPAQKERYGPVLSGFIEVGRAQSGIELQKLLMQRLNFRGALVKLFGDIDLLAIPVTCDAGFSNARMATLGTDEGDLLKLLRFTAPYDMSGHPTLTLPCGFTPEGHPIGFQLVAAHLHEATMLRAGRAYQGATDWHRRHPPSIRERNEEHPA